MNKLEKQACPFCNKKTLTSTEDLKDIPYFGKCYIFSMSCSNCHYHKSDIEAEQKKDPVKCEIEIDSKKDLNIRIVKSSEAIVKLPNLRMSVKPGPDSEGYISNIEGLLERFRKTVEDEKNSADDDEIKKNAKNLLKKFWKIKLGELKTKIVIEDPSGNSAIISEKAKISKL